MELEIWKEMGYSCAVVLLWDPKVLGSCRTSRGVEYASPINRSRWTKALAAMFPRVEQETDVERFRS